MKFADIAHGESFQFGKGCSQAPGNRYKKIDDNHYESSTFGDGVKIPVDPDCKVRSVGPAFYSGHQLWSQSRPAPEDGYRSFVWYDDKHELDDKQVQLEDIINAGYANNIEYTHKLVLPPIGDSQRIDLVTPVKRINENTFELALDDKHPEDISRVMIVDGNSYFTVNKDSSDDREPLSWMIASGPIKHFINNELRYTNAKELAQHEIDYLMEKRAEQDDDQDSALSRSGRFRTRLTSRGMAMWRVGKPSAIWRARSVVLTGRNICTRRMCTWNINVLQKPKSASICIYLIILETRWRWRYWIKPI